MHFKLDITLDSIARNKEIAEKLILKLTYINTLFDDSNDLNSLKLCLQDKNILKIFELEDDMEMADTAIAQLLQEIKNNELESNIPLTKTRFFDAIINDWYESKTIELMLKGKLPKDGYDTKTDFFNFAYKLAEMIKLIDSKSISPKSKKLWDEFFRSTNPDVNRGFKACPLVVDGNSVKFADDCLIDYFITRKSFEEVLENQYCGL